MTPDEHVATGDSAGALQKSQSLHLHSPQCVLENSIAQNDSHCSYELSSDCAGVHGLPWAQKSHPWHLHRPQ